MTLAVRATAQGPIPEAIHKQLWECVGEEVAGPCLGNLQA